MSKAFDTILILIVIMNTFVLAGNGMYDDDP